MGRLPVRHGPKGQFAFRGWLRPGDVSFTLECAPHCVRRCARDVPVLAAARHVTVSRRSQPRLMPSLGAVLYQDVQGVEIGCRESSYWHGPIPARNRKRVEHERSRFRQGHPLRMNNPIKGSPRNGTVAPRRARHVIPAGPVQIAAETFGDAANPAIVLIMGATASMLGWPARLCERLAAEGFFVLRYDHRDTGQSTTFGLGAAAYSVEALAQDLVEVLACFGIRQAHVVGMSLGGYIGQWLAVHRSSAVATLTLISAEPLGWAGMARRGPGSPPLSCPISKAWAAWTGGTRRRSKRF